MIRILSNNQWKCDNNSPDWAAKGEDCSAEGRVDGLARAYLSVMPDIIGLQEASEKMTMLLMERLYRGAKDARYELVTGGDTPILFRSDRFQLMASGFLRYPELIPGMEGSFNNAGTKSYTWAVLEALTDRKPIAVMSTHLWWKSSHPEDKDYQPDSNKARSWQIRLAMSKMEEILKEYRCPCFIMGDFNASMDSLCMEACKENGWEEVHDLAVGECDETNGHHNCYGWGYTHDEPKPFDKAIDHIVCKAPCQLTVQRFLRMTAQWFDCISDHFPLYIDIAY